MTSQMRKIHPPKYIRTHSLSPQSLRTGKPRNCHIVPTRGISEYGELIHSTYDPKREMVELMYMTDLGVYHKYIAYDDIVRLVLYVLM